MRITIVALLVGCSSHHAATMPDGAADAGEDASAPLVGPRGVFVPTFGARVATDAMLQTALNAPAVDGVFVAVNWRDVESTPDQYDFETKLGADLRAVAAAGKHATIAIAAGINAPKYVCATTTCLDLVIRLKQGNNACNYESLPLPWDPSGVLQDRFGKVVTALATYIRSDAVLSQTVIGVKITGLNDHDAETILPIQTAADVPCTVGTACGADQICHETDTVAALTAAGYTPDVANSAFQAFAGDFRAAFPGLPIGSQITRNFPAPGDATLAVTMVDQLIANATLAPVTVQDNGLTATGGVDNGTLAASTAHVPVGYQMLAYVANNPTCLMAGSSGAPCDESVLRAAVDRGLANGARWLEIYKQDVQAYPDTIGYAHDQLTR